MTLDEKIADQQSDCYGAITLYCLSCEDMNMRIKFHGSLWVCCDSSLRTKNVSLMVYLARQLDLWDRKIRQDQLVWESIWLSCQAYAHVAEPQCSLASNEGQDADTGSYRQELIPNQP